MYVRPRPRFRPRNAGGVPFSPALLFTSGVAGAWYDPSDTSTLFQDSAGTTPVTAVEQPVGLMLDKSQGLVASTKAGRFANATNSSISTPDSAAISLTGSIEIIVRLAMPSWAPAANYWLVTKGTSVGNLSYDLVYGSSQVNFRSCADGSTMLDHAVAHGTPFAAGQRGWLRVRFVASTNTMTLFKADDSDSVPTTWTTIGSVTSGGGAATSLFDSSQPLFIGSMPSAGFLGAIYRTQLYNGLIGSGATLVADFQPTLYTGGSTFTATTGEVWTINGATTFIAPDGNHASQATAASRPILRARYNQLTYSEQFDNAAWTKAPTSVITAVTANTTLAPDGTTTADQIASTASGTFRAIRRSPAGLTANTQFTFSVYAKAGTTNWIVMRFWDSGASGINAWFNVSTGAVGTVETGCTATITPANNGFYRCTYTRTVGATIAFNEIDIGVCDSDNTQNANTGANVIVWGADLRTGSSAGTYQRIAAATDYATAGFLPYLYFVTDDSFGTNSIDFTATDKMFACVGVTKSSDATDGMLAELSSSYTTNPGSFYITAPEIAPGAKYAIAGRGAGAFTSDQLAKATSTAYNAPSTVVLTGIFNISGDSNNLRLNGTSIATATGDQGTGNYGNYPLYIGRRNNATVPFNGNIYQMVFCGKTLSASELASTEAYVNSKTGAY